MGAILAATIRVVNQPLARPLGGYCPKDGLHDQLLRHAGIEGIANQFAVEQVLDASKVSFAPAGKTSVAMTVGGTREKLSMIAAVTNQGKTR